jgi:hypothetical protein
MAGQQVQSIAVVNEGAFSMTFWISYDGPDGQVHWSDNNSGDYPVGQDRTIDLSQCHSNDPKTQHKIPEGATVWPTVKADLGKQADSGQKVVYRKNGQKATYKAHGTTLNVHVDLT